MICPKCGYEQPDGHPECLACGVIFAKANPSPSLPAVKGEKQQPADTREEPVATLRRLLFPEFIEVNPIALAVKTILWSVLVIWAFKFIFSSVDRNDAGQSLLHLVNLPFHEAGHILLSPFGRFMAVLGGTLLQLFMPLVCMGVLLIRTRDAFGASVALWWLAQNFMDVAPYINDACDLNLILLGGVTGKEVADYHDWEFILRNMGLLRMDHFLAWSVQVMGSALMLTALVWGAVCLWKQKKALNPFSVIK